MIKSISFSGSALEQLHTMTCHAVEGVRVERGVNVGRPEQDDEYFDELDRLEDCYVKLERRIAKKLGVQSEYPNA